MLTQNYKGLTKSAFNKSNIGFKIPVDLLGGNYFTQEVLVP